MPIALIRDDDTRLLVLGHTRQRVAETVGEMIVVYEIHWDAEIVLSDALHTLEDSYVTIVTGELPFRPDWSGTAWELVQAYGKMEDRDIVGVVRVYMPACEFNLPHWATNRLVKRVLMADARGYDPSNEASIVLNVPAHAIARIDVEAAKMLAKSGTIAG